MCKETGNHAGQLAVIEIRDMLPGSECIPNCPIQKKNPKKKNVREIMLYIGGRGVNTHLPQVYLLSVYSKQSTAGHTKVSEK